MTSKQPLVVLVPGCWSGPAAYRKLVEALQARSFTVHVPDLPTNNGSRPPNSTYQDDVDAVRKTVEPLVNDGNDVFMLMHSYGGAVGTNAVEGLARKDRQAKGLPGGVVHLFYLAGYLLAKGQSVWKIIEKSGLLEQMTPLVKLEDDGTWMPNDAVWGMYHDLDPEDQQEQMRLLRVNNSACAYGETTYEAWRDIPSTYVRTTEDRWVPPTYQDICVGNTKDAGVPLDVAVLNSAHSPYAKFPKEVADLVVKASSA
ncbi:alpha/beta-hydrolase [Hypoxylon sp. FL1284]|nr:alpha/beta-hydrolase [Hypoxylon sp. FL1284]